MLAHSVNERGQRHDLVEHLRGVAGLAARFADGLQGSEAAYFLGLCHDLGKFSPDFQRYLLECEQNPRGRGHGPDHKAAGAWLAAQHLGPLAWLVQGHHGGIQSRTDSTTWLQQQVSKPSVADALSRARQAIPDLEPQTGLEPPEHTRHSRTAAELWLRMVFSALVDADYLDTEGHFAPEKAAQRGTDVTVPQLWERFQGRHASLSDQRTSDVNQVRREVYEACLAAAENPPGMYRLTVPTGGGKTLSAMAFALRHSIKHGHQRVIVAVPFISITQQTAQVYRDIFQTPAEDGPAVLEHHSMADTEEDDDFHRGQVWARLSAENWDAPIVVTTTVQLFQSLFSNKPSHTRKLHRLAKSVIILDEAQALPPYLLTPILDILRDLCEHYGVTLVLSTATQPAFEAIKGFADLPAHEIVPDSARYFQALRRVGYQWRTNTALPWADVASLMQEEHQALAVVNTKKDALALLDALGDPEALHLSTMLCGDHRRQVINEVKSRLCRVEPCRLVSTQVVEAGVDLDFPLVLRALGPLDGIIQAAGRCNREGRLTQGRVVVFRPEGGGMPKGSYRTGVDITEAMLRSGPIDMDDPTTAVQYFWRLFPVLGTDREGIQELRASLNYPEVARRFRMIDDDTVGVVITNFGSPEQRSDVKNNIEELRSGTPRARHLLRRLQPYTVSMYRRQVPAMDNAGLLWEVTPGLYEWRGRYDAVRGIGGVTSLDPDALIV